MSNLLLLGVGGARGSSSFASGFHGAQIEKASDQTGADYTTATAISWDQAQFDTFSFWSAGSPTEITIPAAGNGYYIVVLGSVALDGFGTSTNSAKLTIEKNSGGGYTNNYAGAGGHRRDRQSGADGTATKIKLQAKTQVIQVSTGDKFRLVLQTFGDTSTDIIAAQSSFGIFVVGASVLGCLIKKSADLTGQNISGFPNVTFNTDVYDTDGAGGGFHDTGVNTSRITIPASMNGRMIRLKGNARITSASAANTLQVAILKAGAGFTATGAKTTKAASAAERLAEIETQPFLAVTGDYFELQCGAAGALNVDISQYTTFSLEVLPSAYQGVAAKLSSDKTTQNYSTPAAISFDGADLHDADAAHDPSGSPTEIIVPSAWNGKKGILLAGTYSTLGTANTGYSLMFQRDTGGGYTSDFDGQGGDGGDPGASTDHLLQAHSQIVELVTGHKYRTRHYNADASITMQDEQTTFGLRVLPEL